MSTWLPFCESGLLEGREPKSEEKYLRIEVSYFVWKGDKHERVPWPDMQVIGVYCKGGIPFGIYCSWHSEF